MLASGILLDENVSEKTLKRLKSKGIQARSVKTEKLFGTKNGKLLSLCRANNWILVTHDRDFLDIGKKQHSGIILIRIHPATDEMAGPALERFLSTITGEGIQGKIIILERDGWRYSK